MTAKISIGFSVLSVISLVVIEVGDHALESSTSLEDRVVNGGEHTLKDPGVRITEQQAKDREIAKRTVSSEDIDLDKSILSLAKMAGKECSQALEIAIEQGIKSEEEIFSTLYFPVFPLTSPRTFSTFYDDYTDGVITRIEDRYLEKDSRIVFVVLVDRNGYLPSHNSIFSQQRTGNLELDIRRNRTKRIFNDVTGFSAARNKEEFLLQVYRRDTGEIMADLSVPVFVKGKHWGALRVGYLRGE